MKHMTRVLVLVAVAALSATMLAPAMAAPGGTPGPPDDKPGGGHTETYGNNLSFPVIWSDGVLNKYLKMVVDYFSSVF